MFSSNAQNQFTYLEANMLGNTPKSTIMKMVIQWCRADAELSFPSEEVHFCV